MLSKYKQPQCGNALGDRQTDRMFWYNNHNHYKIQSKVKSSPATKKQDHQIVFQCPPITHELFISSSEGYRGWRRETHHRCSRCASARSWTGAHIAEHHLDDRNVAGRNGERGEQHHHHRCSWIIVYNRQKTCLVLVKDVRSRGSTAN